MLAYLTRRLQLQHDIFENGEEGSLGRGGASNSVQEKADRDHVPFDLGEKPVSLRETEGRDGESEIRRMCAKENT